MALELAFGADRRVPAGLRLLGSMWGGGGFRYLREYCARWLAIEKETGDVPQTVTVRSLEAITAVGGPRCCNACRDWH